MSNINELTAKLKAAAIYEQLHTFMAVKPGDILVLTEVLEAAEKRIAELEALTAEQDQRLMSYAGIATKNAASEARTLTVKLPKASRVKLVSGEYVHGWKAYDITCAISNAGIKLQIEGE